MEKELYDARGKQSNIFRLMAWDDSALVHMITYRILIFGSIITAILYFVSLAFPQYQIYFRIMFLAVWVLFASQLFAVVTGLVVMLTKGLSLGHLNESYVESLSANKMLYEVPEALPYAALGIWILGFFVMLFAWF